jgi:chemotaxis protein methyltransferase CheR
MPELGIVDIREIIRNIQSDTGYDFANFALTAFKLRLERLMAANSIGTAESLIRRIREEQGFFDHFLFDLSVPSTEMFRDPSLWRWLREDYFPAVLDRNPGKFRIWLPSCVSGGELFTLAILLNESGWSDKVQITAGCLSQKALETIQTGIYELKKTEVSEENYKRFNGNKSFSAYYKPERNGVILQTSLLSQVEFRKTTLNYEPAPVNTRLILYRNQMIYFNATLQEKIMHTLRDSLSATGHLVTGIREKLSGMTLTRDFEVVNATESIYRKRLSM